jgi:opacity protein-like surface antigen
MKNRLPFLVAAVLICGYSSLFSQTKKGAWELSMSGNFGSVSSKTESEGSFGRQEFESEAQGYLSLIARPGFYFTDGLVLEPEVLWTALEGTEPSLSLSGNLAYNFNIPQSRVTPFVLIGYGTGNAIPFFQRLLFRSSSDLDISLLNLGAGVKFFLSEHAALRTEYRFQRFSQEETFGSGSFSQTIKEVSNFHNFFFGFSVFLR